MSREASWETEVVEQRAEGQLSGLILVKGRGQSRRSRPKEKSRMQWSSANPMASSGSTMAFQSDRLRGSGPYEHARMSPWMEGTLGRGMTW